MKRKITGKKVFGALLREWREFSQLTQKQISEEVGYSTAQFVSNWERGVSYPPIDAIKPLAKILNQTIGHVLYELYDCKHEDLDSEHEMLSKKLEVKGTK